MRPVQQARQHLTRLIGIVVHGLFAHQHQIGFLAPHNGREDLRHTPGIKGSVEINPDGTIRSHRQRSAKFALEIGIADGDCGHFHPRATLLADVQGFFERDCVKWIDDVRHSCVFDSRSVRADTDPFVSRRNTLGGNENFHIIAGRAVLPHALELLVIDFIGRRFRQRLEAAKQVGHHIEREVLGTKFL